MSYDTNVILVDILNSAASYAYFSASKKIC